MPEYRRSRRLGRGLERGCLDIPITIISINTFVEDDSVCLGNEMQRRTTTMRNHSLPPDFLDSLRFNQAYDGMVCTSRFECANFLMVFTFEVEVDLRVGGARVARSRSDVVQGMAG